MHTYKSRVDSLGLSQVASSFVSVHDRRHMYFGNVLSVNISVNADKHVKCMNNYVVSWLCENYITVAGIACSDQSLN